MKLLTPLTLVAALVFVAPYVCHAEDGVLVPIDRAEKVGLKQKLAVDVENSMKMALTVGGEAVQNQDESWKATTEFTRTTDKVSEQGKPIELTIEIHKMTLTEAGETSEPLKKGTIVKAIGVDGKDSFTVEGAPVDENVNKVLDMMLDVSPSQKGDENKAFGVDKPRKAGEEWEVNTKELLATMPEDMPFIMKEDATKGKMKLVEVTGEGDKKLATLQGDIEMTVTGMNGMPPGFEAKASTLRVALDGQFPIDSSKQPIRQGMSMIIDFTGKFATPDGQKADMKMNASMIMKSKEMP